MKTMRFTPSVLRIPAHWLKAWPGLLVFFSLLLTTARADMLGPSMASFANSNDYSKIVRFFWSESRGKRTERLAVFSYDKSKDAYVLFQNVEVEKPFNAQSMFVSDDGRSVIIVSLSGAGFSVYRDGKLAKDFPLSTFLSEAEIAACLRTGSTLQWFERGAMEKNSFHFIGPARSIHNLDGSYSVMRGADRTISFDFRLDLKALTLTKDQ